jgi:hypothetical protein
MRNGRYWSRCYRKQVREDTGNTSEKAGEEYRGEAVGGVNHSGSFLPTGNFGKQRTNDDHFF